MKRVISGILALLLILTVVPCENMGKVQAAEEDYAVFATCGYDAAGAHLFAWEGDDVTLSVRVADRNQNYKDVDITGTDYNLKWYLVTEDGAQQISGESGTTYTIAEINSEYFYHAYRNYLFFECRLFKGNVQQNLARFYIYGIEQSFGEADMTSILSDTLREGWVKSLDSDNLGEGDYTPWVEDFADNMLDYKWYKVRYNNETNQYLMKELVSEERYYTTAPLTEEDFTVSETDERGYLREVFCDGRQLESVYCVLYKDPGLPEYLSVGDVDIVYNNEVAETFPDGVRYDRVTNTLTLENYNNSTENGRLVSADNDLNIVLKGTNSYQGTMSWGAAIDVSGRLCISGNGSLDITGPKWLSGGVKAEKHLVIQDCTIRMNAVADSYYGFYGITMEPWENYYNNEKSNEECYIKIQNATIDIKGKGSGYSANVGIDAQDADLTIIDSDINVELNGGNKFGVTTGLYKNGEYYGGELSIDDKSNVIINADAKGYLMYYYSGNIATPYLYTGVDDVSELTTAEAVFEAGQLDRKNAYCKSLELSTHEWKASITPATMQATGLVTYDCTTCDLEKADVIIPKLSGTISALPSTCGYTGKACTPEIYVYDENGDEIDSSRYTVTYKNNVEVGTATATIKLKGIYSGTLTKKFEIDWALSAPQKVSAKLYGYNDVEVSWSKVEDATHYDVYYKASNWKSYKKLGTTTKTAWKKANLSSGVKYTFKIVPYDDWEEVKYYGKPKTVSIYTLKKLAAPTVKKASSSKVKISWKNISGESGYQISQSTSKSKTKVVSTYNTTSGKSKTIKATKKKTYYYKVRAYKTVGSKKIYGPWSSVKAYKLK